MVVMVVMVVVVIKKKNNKDIKEKFVENRVDEFLIMKMK